MFYAIFSPYGINTMSKADRLARFQTRAARDAWAEDAWSDGRMVRGEITRDDARRWFPEAFRADADDRRRDGGAWEGPDRNGARFWGGSPTGGGYAYM